MKLLTRIGLLALVVVAVLLAEQAAGAPTLVGRLLTGAAPAPTPAAANFDPSLPAVGYNDSTIAGLERQLQQDGGDWQSYQQLGFAYIQKARDTGDPSYYGRAEAALKRAQVIEPGDSDTLVGLGSLALSRHDFAQALVWGQQAQALSPANPRVYGVLTDADTELGDYPAAVAAAQAMVDHRPDLSSYSRVSYQRELHGDMAGAVAAMQQAITAGSPNAENTNWCRVQLGQLYWLENDLAAAEAQYQRVLAAYPQYMYALAAMGQLRAGQGRWADAATYYQQAIAVVPQPAYVAALADIYTKLGKTADAQQQIDLFLFIAHTFEVNGVNFGIEKAVFLADHNQDLGTALTLAHQAGATRQDIHTQDSLAWVLYKNGRYAEAQAAAAQALRLGTADPLIYFHAGMIAAALGQPIPARGYLEHALALNPQFHPLFADLARATLAGLGH